MESLSVGKMNFNRTGNSAAEGVSLPRHSSGISAQASPSVFPAYGPVASLQSTLVSHASPSGSTKFEFSGNSGAKERAPQMRGLKTGAMRVGEGFSKLSRTGMPFRRGGKGADGP